MNQFEELGINKDLSSELSSLGIESPTEVQKIAIPVILKEKDVVVRSKTGTGKTYAFLLPILNYLSYDNSKGVKALLLSPTRELALQTYKSILALEDPKFKPVVVYGGVSINPQISKAMKSNIVIGTPGRALDLINRKAIDISAVKFVVIDEVDTMLDMGFIDDVDEILSHTNKDKQTMLFSATVPRELNSVISKHTKDAEFISVGEDEALTVKTIKHSYVRVDENQKFQALLAYISETNVGKAIVFTKTKATADILQNALKNAGITSLMMHGGLTQDRRERILENFKSKGELLITTDVLSRGIDIKDIDCVINYDLPNTSDIYVHRVGRSARMGKNGLAFTIATRDDADSIRLIQSRNKIHLEEIKLPLEKYKELASSSIKEAISKSKYSSRGRNTRGSMSHDSGNRGFNRGGSRYGHSNGYSHNNSYNSNNHSNNGNRRSYKKNDNYIFGGK